MISKLDFYIQLNYLVRVSLLRWNIDIFRSVIIKVFHVPGTLSQDVMEECALRYTQLNEETRYRIKERKNSNVTEIKSDQWQ